jgi:hypothetical protein
MTDYPKPTDPNAWVVVRIYEGQRSTFKLGTRRDCEATAERLNQEGLLKSDGTSIDGHHALEYVAEPNQRGVVS